MIEIKNLSYRTDKEILSDINLTIKRKEVHGIVGLSGAGKSTLLKLIGGLLDYTEGIIKFQGKKIFGPSNKLIAGYENLQIVNQDFSLDLHHTVRENIRVQAQHLNYEDREELVDELLELVFLKEIQHLKAIQISGGEQQRLALVRALAKEPKVLLLDEPFAHLDVHLKPRIINYLLKLRDVRGIAIVLVTHNGSEAMAMCDIIHFLHETKIKRSATAKEFYYSPTDLFEGAFFGEINSIVLNRKRFIFRPNQYLLNGDESSAISIRFIRAIFQGSYYANYFKTQKREEIVLFASESLENIVNFWITDFPSKSH
jgi:ABC-type Fe3+/spermidine/putrescine transport system ATPase subunit